MKDIVISGRRILREVLIYAGCFVAALAVNVIRSSNSRRSGKNCHDAAHHACRLPWFSSGCWPCCGDRFLWQAGAAAKSRIAGRADSDRVTDLAAMKSYRPRELAGHRRMLRAITNHLAHSLEDEGAVAIHAVGPPLQGAGRIAASRADCSRPIFRAEIPS